MAGRADGYSVVIEEVDGAHSVELRQSYLPEQGVDVGGKQRLVKTHYPGANAASVQVLGAEESDIVLRGWLRDVWEGVDGLALVQRAQIEQVRRRQRLCQLQWGEVFTVRGFLREANFKLHRETDIEYELTFDVVESDAPETLAARAFPSASRSEIEARMSEALSVADELETWVNRLNVLQAVL